MLADVLRELPTLSAQDRRSIVTTIQTLDKLGPAKREDVSCDDWLLDGILDELKLRRLLAGRPSQKQLMKVNGWQKYQEEAPGIRSYFEQSTPGFNRVQRKLFGITAAHALADHITKFPGVSLRNMLININLLPAAVDHAFPGYMDAGLLAIVVTGVGRSG